ncbi:MULTISPECIES: polysaccharide biosynthesis/export family protein [unclassified Sphingomonas]|jgi:polysaccharide biosynthesis/export protein|uniref:polysaccharide biosynthesis/export family protein n=2 Tax=Pseudomonadota TaxID=1224 RepID=UPI000AAAAF98|nr:MULTISPECIES: polysaccharide biosynthesis/export family protein [unclassified Sphingomonas]
MTLSSLPRASARAFLVALALLVGGCATLPSSGPTGAQVVAISRPDARLPARLVDLDADALPEANAASTPPETLAGLAADGVTDRIGPGDVLQVSIFEIGTALFAGPGATATVAQPAAAGTNLPPITVATDGTIQIPYVGRISAAGETAQSLAAGIEARLIGYSQHAQVSVAIRENIANAVFVLGGVKMPGRIPLSLAREHLLDAVALAGGAVFPAQDTTVRITRAGRSAEIGLDALLAGSPDDLLLLPGDRIELLRQLRSFTVFGASDKVSEIPFEARRLSLAQAVARAGGPSDRQADPTAIFVFRWAAAHASGAAPVPVIYRLNMLRPESYFVSQRFAMRDGDVIYIANARSNQASKLVQIINQLFSPFYGVRELTR